MVWGLHLVRFPTPVKTGPGAHPTSCTTCTRSLSLGEQQLGCGINHPTPSSSIIEKVELYQYALSEISWPVLG